MSIRCYDVSDPTFYFFSCFPVVMMNLHQFIHHFGQISTMSKTLPAVPDLAWFRVHDPDRSNITGSHGIAISDRMVVRFWGQVASFFFPPIGKAHFYYRITLNKINLMHIQFYRGSWWVKIFHLRRKICFTLWLLLSLQGAPKICCPACANTKISPELT